MPGQLITPRTSIPTGLLRTPITFTEPQYVNIIHTFGHRPKRAPSYQPDRTYAEATKNLDHAFLKREEELHALEEVLALQQAPIMQIDDHHC